MDFIKHKFIIGLSAIIILLVVSVHGSLKPPGKLSNKTKNKNNKPKSLAAIDKQSGLPTFIQRIIMPR